MLSSILVTSYPNFSVALDINSTAGASPEKKHFCFSIYYKVFANSATSYNTARGSSILTGIVFFHM